MSLEAKAFMYIWGAENFTQLIKNRLFQGPFSAIILGSGLIICLTIEGALNMLCSQPYIHVNMKVHTCRASLLQVLDRVPPISLI